MFHGWNLTQQAAGNAISRTQCRLQNPGAPTPGSGDATTTTAASGGGAECTRGDLISAALPTADPAFDLVDDFGCEDGYAWIWLADDATDPVTLASRILKDENGTWVPVSTNVCGAASAGIPPTVLEKGCAAI